MGVSIQEAVHTAHPLTNQRIRSGRDVGNQDQRTTKKASENDPHTVATPKAYTHGFQQTLC